MHRGFGRNELAIESRGTIFSTVRDKRMDAQYESAETRPQAVSRLGLYLPVGLLLVAAILWSGFWWIGSRTANGAIDGWLASEASAGRHWSCPNRTMGGFPFRLELRCGNASLRADVEGKPVALTLGGLTIVAQVYNPKLVLADLDGPLTIDDGTTPSAITWKALRLSLRLATNRLERLSLVVAQPSSNYRADDGRDVSIGAKALELHLRSDGERPAADNAIDVALLVTAAELPQLDGLTGTPDKTDLVLQGAITRAADLHCGSWRRSLENWRSQGGRIDLQTGKIIKGPMRIETTGALDLDDEHRVQGQLSASADGAGPLLAKLGVSSGGALKGVLGGLMGKRADAFIGAATSLQWPVRLQDGRIFVGPIKTPVQLRPLY
ncbi:MAG: hypothetical protein JWL62_2717 [Hyphomicrobiales bacterium]|nr:hypothetical protein [Hyphomicrobiales bacterium]